MVSIYIIIQMRIYTYLIKELSQEMKKKLTSFYEKTQTFNRLWTPDGLFQLEAQQLYRVAIKDVPIRKSMLGIYPVTIDASEFIRAAEVSYQVPPQSHPEFIQQKIYRLTPTSPVEWIFEYDINGDTIQENYFRVPEADEQRYKTDILHFLSLI